MLNDGIVDGTNGALRARELFWDQINQVAPFAGTHVLDVGCGDGLRSQEITRRQCRFLIGIDPDPQAIDVASRRRLERAAFELGRAEDLRVKKKFDRVVFALSLHHVPIALMNRAIFEAVMVCADGGLLIFVEPMSRGHGSFYEAEVLFGACDGDEEREKAAAEEAIETHHDLRLVTKLENETVFRFRSRDGFRTAMAPNRNMAALPEFLERHRENGEIVLRAKRRIWICASNY